MSSTVWARIWLIYHNHVVSLKLVSLMIYSLMLLSLTLSPEVGARSNSIAYLFSIGHKLFWVFIFSIPIFMRSRYLFLGKGGFNSRLFVAGLGIMLWMLMLVGGLNAPVIDTQVMLDLVPLFCEVWIFARIIEERQVVYVRA